MANSFHCNRYSTDSMLEVDEVLLKSALGDQITGILPVCTYSILFFRYTRLRPCLFWTMLPFFYARDTSFDKCKIDHFVLILISLGCKIMMMTNLVFMFIFILKDINHWFPKRPTSICQNSVGTFKKQQWTSPHGKALVPALVFMIASLWHSSIGAESPMLSVGFLGIGSTFDSLDHVNTDCGSQAGRLFPKSKHARWFGA